MYMAQCSVCGVKAFNPDTSDSGWIVDNGNELCPAHAEGRRSAASAPRREFAVVGFDRPEPGSEHRYHERAHERPWTAHTFWWIIHNVIAHPLIGLIPVNRTFKFHDWTSYKMHGK